MLKIEGDAVMKPENSWLAYYLGIKFLIFTLCGLIFGVSYLIGAGLVIENPELKPEEVIRRDISVELVQRSLQHGADINRYNEDGFTALMMAAKFANYEVCKYLIDHGADINMPSRTTGAEIDIPGTTALQYAIFGGNVDIVELLLKEKADVESRNAAGYTPLGYTLFMPFASDREKTTDLLINAGANINDRDNLGNTVLEEAVRKPDVAMCDYFVKKYGYSINYKIKNYEGYTAYDIARSTGNIVIMSLLEGATIDRLGIESPVNDYGTAGLTGLMIAALRNDLEYAQRLLDRGPEINLQSKGRDSNTALHFSCLGKAPEVAELLLKYNASVLVKNEQGNIPLHFSYRIADKKSRDQLINHFVDRGASMNAANSDGNTLLHILINDVRLDKVKDHIAHFSDQINFSAKNKAGLTPLALAKTLRSKKIEEVIAQASEWVLGIKTGVNDRNNRGLTGLMIAAQRGDVDYTQQLISLGATVDLVDPQGNTALYRAVFYRNPETMKLLLLAKAAVNKKNNVGDTPLHIVFRFTQSSECIAATQMLIQYGGNIYEQNNEGNTPLHLAVQNNMLGWVALFASPFGKAIKNKQGKTPYDLARDLGLQEMMRVLGK